VSNSKLFEIYNSNWDALRLQLKQLSANEYTNPLLLSFDEDKLNKAHLRVMVFGQETKGWYDTFSGLDNLPNLMMEKYNKFFCEENFSKGYRKSSFWKAFRYFNGNLKKHQPDKEIYCIWNNINKIGKSDAKTGISRNVRLIERGVFSVISAEIQVFKPHVVIFMTGPNRDNDIRHHFPDAIFEAISPNFNERKLAKVHSDFLPKNTIRLCHPSFFGGFYKVRSLALKQILSTM
jgi:hypothetical protein